MVLMSRETGKVIDDFEHLKQSITDILLTPLGSRVWVRNYGSILFFLIDRNMTPLLVSQFYGGIAEALDTWEPRFEVTDMSIDASQMSKGHLICDLEGIYLPNAQPIRFPGIELVYSTNTPME